MIRYLNPFTELHKHTDFWEIFLEIWTLPKTFLALETSRIIRMIIKIAGIEQKAGVQRPNSGLFTDKVYLNLS